MLELGVAVGVILALLGLAVGLQTVAELRQEPCHRLMADVMPHLPRASARWRVLLQVHSRGDIGSPRVAGSTSG